LPRGGELSTLSALLTGAVPLVYDYYNALVIGFGPASRASDAVLSLVMYPRQISVCFLRGAALADPDRLLRGRVPGRAASSWTIRGDRHR
jgi:hypothetical protein